MSEIEVKEIEAQPEASTAPVAREPDAPQQDAPKAREPPLAAQQACEPDAPPTPAPKKRGRPVGAKTRKKPEAPEISQAPVHAAPNTLEATAPLAFSLENYRNGLKIDDVIMHYMQSKREAERQRMRTMVTANIRV